MKYSTTVIALLFAYMILLCGFANEHTTPTSTNTACLNDTIPPIASCHLVHAYSYTLGNEINAYARHFDNGSYDDQGVVELSIARITADSDGDGFPEDDDFQEQISLTESDLYDTTAVVLRVEDAAGNRSYCTSSFTLNFSHPFIRDTLSCDDDISQRLLSLLKSSEISGNKEEFYLFVANLIKEETFGRLNVPEGCNVDSIEIKVMIYFDSHQCPDCDLIFFYVIHTNCGLVSDDSSLNIRLNPADYPKWTMRFPVDVIIREVAGERPVIPEAAILADIMGIDDCSNWWLERVWRFHSTNSYNNVLDYRYYLRNSELADGNEQAEVERSWDMMTDEEDAIVLRYEDRNNDGINDIDDLDDGDAYDLTEADFDGDFVSNPLNNDTNIPTYQFFSQLGNTLKDYVSANAYGFIEYRQRIQIFPPDPETEVNVSMLADCENQLPIAFVNWTHDEQKKHLDSLLTNNSFGDLQLTETTCPITDIEVLSVGSVFEFEHCFKRPLFFKYKVVDECGKTYDKLLARVDFPPANWMIRLPPDTTIELSAGLELPEALTAEDINVLGGCEVWDVVRVNTGQRGADLVERTYYLQNTCRAYRLNPGYTTRSGNPYVISSLGDEAIYFGYADLNEDDENDLTTNLDENFRASPFRYGSVKYEQKIKIALSEDFFWLDTTINCINSPFSEDTRNLSNDEIEEELKDILLEEKLAELPLTLSDACTSFTLKVTDINRSYFTCPLSLDFAFEIQYNCNEVQHLNGKIVIEETSDWTMRFPPDVVIQQEADEMVDLPPQPQIEDVVTYRYNTCVTWYPHIFSFDFYADDQTIQRYISIYNHCSIGNNWGSGEVERPNYFLAEGEHISLRYTDANNDDINDFDDLDGDDDIYDNTDAWYDADFVVMNNGGDGEFWYSNINDRIRRYNSADKIGDITYVQIIKVIPYGGDVVYPGDTDHNGITNHFDLLPLGLAYETEGNLRLDADIEWRPQISEDWGVFTHQSIIDYKRADTDGNGQVNDTDLQAIADNWGKTNDRFTEENIFERNSGIPIYLAEEGRMLENSYQIPMLLGTEEIPAEDAYGIAFSVKYEIDGTNPESSLNVSVENSWLGSSEELLYIYKHFPDENRVDIAITRKDRISQAGSGEIGALEIGIGVEDILLNNDNEVQFTKSVKFNIEDIRLINAYEEEYPVYNWEQIIEIDEEVSTSTKQSDNLEQGVDIYPNPVRDYLHISSEELIEAATIFDINGKAIRNFSISEQRLDIRQLAQGIYTIQLITPKGVVTKRFEHIH